MICHEYNCMTGKRDGYAPYFDETIRESCSRQFGQDTELFRYRY